MSQTWHFFLFVLMYKQSRKEMTRGVDNGNRNRYKVDFASQLLLFLSKLENLEERIGG